ncbi:SRPBCC family protein [Streptomyces sp. NBC_01190]|uniref:SRPBCC family protein n=1 Tax=Streptomyces sp. NBC_01190 TaxID=2903767 RepID=UPI0038656BA4|nr:SRPBCC family protein [Streptomyces sp. NBC_01190]
MSHHHVSTTERLPKVLGWAGLGLRAAQVTAPKAVSRLTGVPDALLTARTAIPLVGNPGSREPGHAALLPAGREPATWVWTRVTGDTIDLTALGRALAARGAEFRGNERKDAGAGRGGRGAGGKLRTAVTAAALAAITGAGVYAAIQELRRQKDEDRRGTMSLYASITIDRPRAEVYRYWHDLANLPRFMAHLESVETEGATRSHWKARGPAGRTIGWDAEITEDRTNSVIAWQSKGPTPVGNTGSVRFSDAPGDRGTEVRVELSYDPPAGSAGTAVAKLLGEHPEQQVRDDLRRFKQVMETGEVVRSDASPEGTRAFRQARQRPAQPLAAAA